MPEIIVTLPEDLAEEARAGGLLKPDFLASLLRAEIRRRRVNRLFTAADRLAELDEPLTEAEVAAEVSAAREERRRAKHANSS